MKTFNIHQIISRIAKEHHCLHKIKNSDKIPFNSNKVTCLFVLTYHIHQLYIDICGSKKGIECCNEFNLVCFLLMKPLIEKFVHDNCIRNNINNNLNIMNTFHKSKTLQDYLLYMELHSINPYNFFFNLFSWGDTKEGSRYWNSLNTKFYNYLNNLVTI